MLAELVRLGFLITSLRPAMTATDALGHVTAELRAAGAHEIPETGGHSGIRARPVLGGDGPPGRPGRAGRPDGS